MKHRAHLGRISYLRWRSFCVLARIDRRIKSRIRLTAAGRLAAAFLMICALFGSDTHRSVVYQLFSLTMILMLMALLRALWFKPNLRLCRHLPETVNSGGLCEYRLEVHNAGKYPLKSLMLMDQGELILPELGALENSTEPRVAQINLFDRVVGWPLWTHLLGKRSGLRGEKTELPTLAPGVTLQLRMQVHILRRGSLRFSHVLAIRPGTFGLFSSVRGIVCAGEILSLPERYAVRRLPLPGTMRHHSGGEALAMQVGESEEFSSLREFRPGDALRHVSWKVSARLGVPVVKEYQEESFTRHALLLDTWSPENEDALEEAVSAVASYLLVIPNQESLLDLIFALGKTWCLTAGRGLGQVRHLLEMLSGIESDAQDRLAELAPLLLARASRLSGCALVLLHWDEQRAELVRRLQVQGTRVVVLLISAQPVPTDLGLENDCFIHLQPGSVRRDLEMRR